VRYYARGYSELMSKVAVAVATGCELRENNSGVKKRWAAQDLNL
jgi:hypothetical protein